jgi:Rrf2 family protein
MSWATADSGEAQGLRGEPQVLSQKGRYALKALIHLARNNGAARQVSMISAEENIPRKFLEGIMSDLRRARLVVAERGRMGGYRLARPADLITFGEVIRLTDGPLALVPCVSRNFYRRCDDCTDETTCILRQVMARVRNDVSEILDRTTLAGALRDASVAQFVDLGPTENVGDNKRTFDGALPSGGGLSG